MLWRKILAELRLILLSRVTAQKTAEGKTTHRAENPVVASNSHTAATLYISALLSVTGYVFLGFRETLN